MKSTFTKTVLILITVLVLTTVASAEQLTGKIGSASSSGDTILNCFVVM